jgi:YHS domain-containing protein
MKRTILAAMICCTLGSAVLFAADSKSPDANKVPATQPTTKPSAKADGKPVNKYCAINREEEIDPKVTTDYKGKVIGFCCEDCIAKFKKDPEKYMKDLK